MPTIPEEVKGLSIYGTFDDFETGATKRIEQRGPSHFKAALKEVGLVKKFRSYIAISSRYKGELFVVVSPTNGANIYKLFKRTRKACRQIQHGKFFEATP